MKGQFFCLWCRSNFVNATCTSLKYPIKIHTEFWTTSPALSF